MSNWFSDFGNAVANTASQAAFQVSRGADAFKNAATGHTAAYNPDDYDMWGVLKAKPTPAQPAAQPAADSWGELAKPAPAPAPATNVFRGAFGGGNAKDLDMVQNGVTPQPYGGNPSDKTGPAPNGPAGGPVTGAGMPDAHAQAILDLLKAQQGRADKIYTDINALQNPWDTKGEMFTSALGRGIDDTTRNYAGANQRLMTQLGQRGQAGGVGASVAAGNLERQRGQALSDVQSGMYKNALDGTADFAFKKAGALDSLARGNFGDANATLDNLMKTSIAVGDTKFNQGMATAANTRADTALSFSQSNWDRTFTNDEKWKTVDHETQAAALKLAQDNHLGDREAQTWGNWVAALGPTAIKLGAQYGIPAIITMLTANPALGAVSAVTIKSILDGNGQEPTPIKTAPPATTTMPTAYPPAPPGYQSDYGYPNDPYNYGNRS